LKEPAGVAVNEATGNVYFVDKGDQRVEWFNEEGVFQGEFSGPDATGRGTLVSGPSTIESALPRRVRLAWVRKAPPLAL
jgi:DNA-binding beta-propeller fold protein YncE